MPFWKFYNGVDNPVEQKHFCADLKAFLALDSGIPRPAEPPQDMVELHAAVLKVFRGLFGLLDCRPGVASLADVRYIMPDNATTASLSQDIPKFGRALVSATRKDRCSVFVKALDEFQSTWAAVRWYQIIWTSVKRYQQTRTFVRRYRCNSA